MQELACCWSGPPDKPAACPESAAACGLALGFACKLRRAIAPCAASAGAAAANKQAARASVKPHGLVTACRCRQLPAAAGGGIALYLPSRRLSRRRASLCRSAACADGHQYPVEYDKVQTAAFPGTKRRFWCLQPLTMTRAAHRWSGPPSDMQSLLHPVATTNIMHVACPLHLQFCYRSFWGAFRTIHCPDFPAKT